MNNPGGSPPYVPGAGASAGFQGVPPQKSGGLLTPRNIIIALVALLFLCCCCGVALFGAIVVLNPTGTSSKSELGTFSPEEAPVVLVSSNFMLRLKNSDWAGAFALCTPELQKELGSVSGLGKLVTDGQAQPASWSFTSITDILESVPDAQIDGIVVYTSGRSGTLQLFLVRAGASWQINRVSLRR